MAEGFSLKELPLRFSAFLTATQRRFRIFARFGVGVRISIRDIGQRFSHRA
jgi:hypothetical protein